MDELIKCASPVIFETGIADAPFSVAGTSFLAGYFNSIYVVTAAHVVGTYPWQRLHVYPSDKSNVPLRLEQGWTCQDEENEPDSSDIFFARATLDGQLKPARRNSKKINLTPTETSRWVDTRHESMFFAFGYPKVDTFADYDRGAVLSRPLVLRGTYVGNSVAYGCHELALSNPQNIGDFDGLSGSPVFSIPSSIGLSAQPVFCGMLLRGSASSLRVHFLASEILRLALEHSNDA